MNEYNERETNKVICIAFSIMIALFCGMIAFMVAPIDAAGAVSFEAIGAVGIAVIALVFFLFSPKAKAVKVDG